MRGDTRSAERARTRVALILRSAAAASWLALGVAALLADLIHPALRPDDTAAQTTVIVALWLAYVVVLVALLLPGPRALTVVRIGLPAGALEAALAAADSSDLVAVVALFVGLVGTLVVLQPLYAEAHVDAASYGDERRFLLRPPGPLLLAERGWTSGIVAAAVGLPVAAFAAHTLFRLSRRWLVFVPNGLVVHDHLAVTEPLPLSRRSVDSIGPARTDTGAADLTAQAFGMALELRLAEPVKAGVVTGRNRSEERSLRALLMSPSRPAAVLSTAERRGLRIG